MENRKENERYREIAEKLIDTTKELEYIKKSDVTIAFLESTANKKNGRNKFVLGECEKVPPKNKWAIDYDFTITVYAPNVIGMSKKQIEILLLHELLHIGIEKDLSGEETYYINKHDIEEFNAVVDKFGTEWAKLG